MVHSTYHTGDQTGPNLAGRGKKLVVIGGDGAGMSAAAQARRQRPDLKIVALERGPHTSYAA